MSEGEYVEWKQWSAETFGRLRRSERRYYDWHVKRALGAHPCKTVLEVGFGNGAFLGYCKARGWKATGIEIEPQLRLRAQEAGFQVVADIGALPNTEQFDLIALFDVLEHVPSDQSIAFLKSLAAHLQPHGSMLVRVPNGDSPFGRVYQHGDLTHVTAFGQFKLDQLAKLCGLRVAAQGESPWNAQQYEGRTPRALLRGLVKSILTKLLNFAFYGWKVDLSGNLVVVLRRQ